MKPTPPIWSLNGHGVLTDQHGHIADILQADRAIVQAFVSLANAVEDLVAYSKRDEYLRLQASFKAMRRALKDLHRHPTRFNAGRYPDLTTD